MNKVSPKRLENLIDILSYNIFIKLFMLQSNYTDSGEIEFIINKADYDQVRMELQYLKVFINIIQVII